MNAKPTFSIRLKILVTLLLVVTAVVSIITYSMAEMFHEDKKTYIRDLTSVIALSASEECRSLLLGYTDRLRVYGRTMSSNNLSRKNRTELLTTYFQEFRDLVGLMLYEDGREVASVFDSRVLEANYLTKEIIQERLQENPLPFGDLAGGREIVENRTIVESLPMFSLVVPLDPTESGASRSIVALLRLDGLQRLSSRSEVFEIFLVDRNGVLLAHPDPQRILGQTVYRFPEGVAGMTGKFSAGMTTEFKDGGTEMIGGYASPGVGGVTAGVQIPRSAAFIASRHILNRLTVIAALLLAGSAVISILGSRRITRPVERLMTATRRVGRGEFDIQVQVESRDEIGTLSTSFNQMAQELHVRETALKDAQKQLIQSEKMAAFGQLGAGVAHEVKNPLAGILGCAQLSLRKVEDGTPVHRNLLLIEKETKRCKTIVENLLRFARQEKAILEPTDLGPVVDDAAAIVNHQLELHQVKLRVEKADSLLRIRGNANQLQQVLINLLVNAQQAMGEGGGSVTLRTRKNAAGAVELSVSDDGPGIPEENQAKIFEPFFTTKPGGKGTGLGLSVSYGIVKDHGGDIQIQSTPGKGTRFTLTFPVLRDSDLGEAPVNPRAEDGPPVEKPLVEQKPRAEEQPPVEEKSRAEEQPPVEEKPPSEEPALAPLDAVKGRELFWSMQRSPFRRPSAEAGQAEE